MKGGSRSILSLQSPCGPWSRNTFSIDSTGVFSIALSWQRVLSAQYYCAIKHRALTMNANIYKWVRIYNCYFFSYNKTMTKFKVIYVPFVLPISCVQLYFIDMWGFRCSITTFWFFLLSTVTVFDRWLVLLVFF